MLPAKHFTHCMSPEMFQRPMRSTSWACNGCCEISLPTVLGLCPRGQSRCSHTRSRAAFLTAGTSLPPLGHPTGPPWLYSSPFPTPRIQWHQDRLCVSSEIRHVSAHRRPTRNRYELLSSVAAPPRLGFTNVAIRLALQQSCFIKPEQIHGSPACTLVENIPPWIRASAPSPSNPSASHHALHSLPESKAVVRCLPPCTQSRQSAPNNHPAVSLGTLHV